MLNSQARMPMPSSLTVEFHTAAANPYLTNQYLTEILRPGVKDPIEGAFLFDADPEFLAAAGGIIGIGRVGNDLAAGLYISIDGMNTAWIKGVRVKEEFRAQHYGTAIVEEAQAYVVKLGLTRFALTVRCDERGVPNRTAFNVYRRCGFQAVGKPYPVTISGTACDRHLGPAGSTFLTQRMEAGA